MVSEPRGDLTGISLTTAVVPHQGHTETPSSSSPTQLAPDSTFHTHNLKPHHGIF